MNAIDSGAAKNKELGSSKLEKMSAPTSPEPVTLVPGNTLLTKTPEEGRQLAVKLARLIIKATQPDAAVRERLRPIYAEDPAMLIAIGQTVAQEFATIAAANISPNIFILVIMILNQTKHLVLIISVNQNAGS